MSEDESPCELKNWPRNRRLHIKKIKLNSDSFEETYRSTNRSRKKSLNWETQDSNPTRYPLRTYSKKSTASENGEFDSLFDKILERPVVVDSEEENENTPPVFSPDDGPLFASPIASNSPIIKAKSTKKLDSLKFSPSALQSRSRRKKRSKRDNVVSPVVTPCSENKRSSITSTPNTLSKVPIVLLQPLSDSIIEKFFVDPVRCLCSSFDDDNILECDYCPVRIHASCHGVDQDQFREITEVGLLWNCSDCEEKKTETLDDDISSPVVQSFSKEQSAMIPAKGGKKWRRTMASNLLHQAIPSIPETVSPDESIKKLSSLDLFQEEDEIMHRLNDLSLTNKSDTSYDECIAEELESLSPLAKILLCCEQLEVLPFEGIYCTEMFEKSRKVGEGTFGEVYLLNALESESEYPPVLKIIPVDGSQPVNNEPQTTFSEVLTEIKISLYLSNLGRMEKAPNFVSINNCQIVSGLYPKVLLRLWDDYDKEKESLNIRPDYLDYDQKYIAFEFSNGGEDLETTTLYNATQGISVFNQVAHALAVAEELLNFEHRDLHWGNILIQGTTQDIFTYSLDPNNTYCVKSSGIKATIIDFSLSRLTCQVELDDIFKDISNDETLFNAVGDYQFDIYRLMRESNQNDWKSFTPYTNILWLHYLLDKLISSVPYKAVKSRIHRSSMSTLRTYKKNILSYKSAKHFVLSDGVPFDD